MADILDYAVTVTAGAPSPQFRVEARVVDSSNQAVTLKDLTGPRALTWPAAYSTLSDEQQEHLRQLIGGYLVECAAALGPR